MIFIFIDFFSIVLKKSKVYLAINNFSKGKDFQLYQIQSNISDIILESRNKLKLLSLYKYGAKVLILQAGTKVFVISPVSSSHLFIELLKLPKVKYFDFFSCALNLEDENPLNLITFFFITEVLLYIFFSLNYILTFLKLLKIQIFL